MAMKEDKGRRELINAIVAVWMEGLILAGWRKLEKAGDIAIGC